MVSVVRQAAGYAAQKRVIRSPKHGFNLKHKPYAIQPFLIAPVLPGETMKNLLMQTRVISDPVKSPLVGWWIDYVYFYVKHRDLDIRDNLTDMMLNPDWSPDASLVATAQSQLWYTFDDGAAWVKLCLEKVVSDFFRNEGEAWDDFKLADGSPLAGLNQESVLNSLMMGSVPDADEVEITVGVDDKVGASEIDQAMKQWQLLRMHNLTEMDYEDYLRTFGVRPKSVELHKAEVIRVVREWTYPTNTVNPSDGKPSTAVAWSIQERADKDRYFKEPGFIFGVTVARPKVYLDNLKGAAVGHLLGAVPWLPAMLADDPTNSLIEVAEGAGLAPSIAGTGTSYWIDIRDLFIYGDQFVNHTDDAFAGSIALPTTGGQHRYPTEAMVDALFVNAGSAGALFVKQDGIATISIASKQVDTTPGTPVMGT